MTDRLMKVNAYTTLDLVDAVAKGQDFENEAFAVANATTDTENPDCVRLQFELDNMTEEHLPAHMEELELTPDQARTLAADLEKHADRVEDASNE
ncbi:hypothetical protein Htur_2854 [Haloterrigena turkmenica DSM 5511]|uniref:Uncharacterized protein n=1 Tax=Haloterrigena turkmenica (strain ATCC 51198 / DSM 5511 / JCM 9101 / NCIMB 13204 / VKM B-1734 / 4k) TaxID=543526 RepID=D2RXJ9_HALTV|nr:DUF6360 family protein [Haloterrigena turkmenica]ADB61723.1 hypothetical protein Htur_2854 [Haloterrigena turkmenica DSM 5511]